MLEKAWKRPCWPAHVRGLWAACAHLHLGRMFFLLRGAVLGASVSTVSGLEMGRDVSCLWEASSCLCFEQSCVCQNTRPSYLVQGFDAQGLEIPSSYSASLGPLVGSVGFLGKDRNPGTRLLNQMSRCPWTPPVLGMQEPKTKYITTEAPHKKKPFTRHTRHLCESSIRTAGSAFWSGERDSPDLLLCLGG